MIKIVTYNIRHGKGIDNMQELTRTEGVLRDADADIICLQEVDYRNPRSGMTEQARRLARSLDMHWFYQSNWRLGPIAGMGNAILSKQKMYSTWNKFLPSHGERRGVIHAQIKIDGRVVSVFCTHWGLSTAQRLDQARICAEEVQKCLTSGDRVIFCGDLNAEQDREEIVMFGRQSGLANVVPAEIKTFTVDNPYAQIDYVWLSAGLTCKSVDIFQTDASDHFPVYAELEMP